jgi:hypothetical protein
VKGKAQMATQKSTQAAPAASVNDCSPHSLNCPAAAAYRSALAFLDHIYDDQETVLSIAVAGSNIAGEEAVCERRLFDVIVKMTEGIKLIQALRVDITSLARKAGVDTVEVGS